jgi:hypothetical protein
MAPTSFSAANTCPRISNPPPEVGVVLSTLMSSLPTPEKSGSRTAAEIMSLGLIEDLSHTFGGPLLSSWFAGAGGDRGLAFPASGTFPAPFTATAAALLLEPLAALPGGIPPVVSWLGCRLRQFPAASQNLRSLEKSAQVLAPASRLSVSKTLQSVRVIVTRTQDWLATGFHFTTGSANVDTSRSRNLQCDNRLDAPRITVTTMPMLPAQVCLRSTVGRHPVARCQWRQRSSSTAWQTEGADF